MNAKNSKNQQPCPVMSEEAKESFEAELCWCIKQLQHGLQLGKLNAKQMQDHTKTLNTLMSKTTTIVKKRQVMRLSFGDYRSKMAEEERRLQKINQQVKVTTKTSNDQSKFLKKSACGNNISIEQNESTGNARTNFKFNFNIDS
ncbi:hypothetical protein FQR65_LT16090 [Abscondita terminalis]|nr:hypothetical protein FQR65_LT16090 [Abscondita terminalis]